MPCVVANKNIESRGSAVSWKLRHVGRDEGRKWELRFRLRCGGGGSLILHRELAHYVRQSDALFTFANFSQLITARTTEGLMQAR